MDSLFSVRTQGLDNLFDVSFGNDSPPTLSLKEFDAKVQGFLEDGAKNQLSQDYVADQILDFAKTQPHISENDATYESFTNVKEAVKDFYTQHTKNEKAKKMAILTDGTIKVRKFENLERGDLKDVKAVVLHRTFSSSAKSTMDNLYSQSDQHDGAHFLIDKNGDIFLTVPMDKMAQHVGYITPRCEQELTCSPNDSKNINAIWSKRLHIQTKKVQLHNYEKDNKNYPDRYPINSESLGVEIVGMYKDKVGYEAMTIQQKQSLDKLLLALKTKYDLSNEDIYAHTHLSYKDKEFTEGVDKDYTKTPEQCWTGGRPKPCE